MFRIEDSGRYFCLVNNKESSQDVVSLKILGGPYIPLTSDQVASEALKDCNKFVSESQNKLAPKLTA